ncbi:glycosyltransferase family 4 protein [Vibrio sp. 1CM23M]|uniref:glycosyltransferase family 4 protein n=1 Tax=Vibrio sp. 1CM23M TaxID=2929164 RepID=UPI0020BD8652|nr:glycosyltransferase family 4 protein [Vibrio sp. 1CM23M]MCK8073661.1 glycosyltransferase family 4 protein [Vibrio sp. 1CM23M]
MKICHVNLASGYHGGENQTLQLIKQQLKLGYELTVVANPKSPFAKAVQELGCNCILTKHYLFKHQRSITQDSQVIHVHEGRAIYWALIQHLLFNIPYIITRRIDNPLKKKWLSNLAYEKADALVGLSREIVSRIKSVFPNKPVECIPSSPVRYPSNEQNINIIRQQFAGNYLVIHAANMLEHKGFDVTVEAARTLSKQDSSIHFALLGDGKVRRELEERAHGLENISFVGKQEQMGDWFAAADMLVHPSYSEGLGSVILEALDAGLPVAASKAGGIPDIIDHGKSGLLIEPGNADQLAQAILDTKNNERLRNSILHGAKLKLNTFRIEYTAQRYEQLYANLRKE